MQKAAEISAASCGGMKFELPRLASSLPQAKQAGETE